MTGGFVEHPVRVRVPATSANLGPGFDTLGLALGRYDEVQAQVIPAGLDVTVDGEGGAFVARDETHLVVQAIRAAFDTLGVAPGGIALRCHNTIPHGRGLGSSAAAIVAGLLLARTLVEDGAARLPDADVLTLASDIEGHPDNVAPCLLGGLTIAWVEASGARAVRRDPDPEVVPVVFVPSDTASTARVRRLLPASVPHTDAAFTAGRAALLVAALTGSTEALHAATEDRLHQDYRAPAMPATAELVADLRADGLAAVVSGAGPSVLVLARGDAEAQRVAARAAGDWTPHVLAVDASGARLCPALP